MEEGKDWVFKAETAGIPDIELGEYKKYVSAALKQAPTPEKEPKDSAKEEGDTKLTIALDTLIKNAKIAISPFLVEEEAKNALGKLVNQLSALKLSVDDYAKSIKKTRDELVEEYKKTAETNLKVEFLVSAVIKDLKPEVKETDPYKKYAAERHAALDFLSGL
jgi:FKBP-type peptidyl-prolyl cis-trans isomerase (trigger factor)